MTATPLSTGVVQRCGGEAAAEAAAFASLVHFRVRERDPSVPATIRRQPDEASVQPQLVAARLGHVDDLGLRHGAGRGFELAGAAEILHQPRKPFFLCVHSQKGLSRFAITLASPRDLSRGAAGEADPARADSEHALRAGVRRDVCG
jgi:hypothetical protein